MRPATHYMGIEHVFYLARPSPFPRDRNTGAIRKEFLIMRRSAVQVQEKDED